MLLFFFLLFLSRPRFGRRCWCFIDEIEFLMSTIITQFSYENFMTNFPRWCGGGFRCLMTFFLITHKMFISVLGCVTRANFARFCVYCFTNSLDVHRNISINKQKKTFLDCASSIFPVFPPFFLFDVPRESVKILTWTHKFCQCEDKCHIEKSKFISGQYFLVTKRHGFLIHQFYLANEFTMNSISHRLMI